MLLVSSFTLSDDRPGCASRQPVAGAGPHGGGGAVVVVDGTLEEVVVELLEDELLLEDVVLVVVVEVVHGRAYAPGWEAGHVPAFRDGLLGRHGLPGNVVVVVVPAVHTDEPGGALVLGGHEVHAAAPPLEYVSAGHARQADAPAAAA